MATIWRRCGLGLRDSQPTPEPLQCVVFQAPLNCLWSNLKNGARRFCAVCQRLARSSHICGRSTAKTAQQNSGQRCKGLGIEGVTQLRKALRAPSVASSRFIPLQSRTIARSGALWFPWEG
jgi:hypothetical protein